ncbi:MAG: energy-coupling factor transporter transmembrane protein EcfT [Syntrophales bacterium LBB04]|nr:energy-coupling factor transporter transmembrane protein EcfT [Syntrophales bacterium LBB04]
MYHTGSYIPDVSPLHRLDSRIKLASVFGLSIIILTLKPLTSIFIGLALFSLVFVSGISLRTIGQALKPLLFFMVLIFLAHALFTEGDSLFRVPYLGLSLSWAGLAQGFFVSWRFLCLIVAAVLLTMTTPPSRMIAAVKFFLQPLKLLRIPVDNIAVMIMLALRLMPVLLREQDRLEMARKARGYNVRRLSFFLRIQAFLSLATRILLNVFQRADRLAEAMAARNYQLAPRTSFVELRPAKTDFIVLFFIGIFIVIFIALNSCFG